MQQVLALAALEPLLLLSDTLAKADAPTAVLAPLADAAAPPALRRRAVRAAAAVAAARPRHAPAMLAALEALLLRELDPGRVAVSGDPARGPAPDPAAGLPAAAGANATANPAPSLAEAAAAAYSDAVLADSLVPSNSTYAAIAVCLVADGAPAPGSAAGVAAGGPDSGGTAVAHTAERLVSCLLAAAPPHVQRRMVLGLLTHAPGSAAPRLARGALAELLPEQLRGSDEMVLGLVQAMAGARGAGAAVAGSASCEASTTAMGGGGCAVGPDADHPAGSKESAAEAMAEACAGLLDVGCSAPGTRPLAALLAHLVRDCREGGVLLLQQRLMQFTQSLSLECWWLCC